jgi:hypothetical protein
MDSLKGGLNDLLLSNKQITDVDEGSRSSAKVVKLRFTRRQYEAFRDACKVLEIISSHDGFTDFVKSALNADIRVPTIARQFINPILEAPMRIPVKATKRQSDTKKVTYFTSPIPATDECEALYDQVKELVELKQDVSQGITSLTDVRVMVSAYLLHKDLKTDHGVVLDDFICRLAPATVEYNKSNLLIRNGKYIIPKGDRKVMAGLVSEIAFGKAEK